MFRDMDFLFCKRSQYFSVGQQSVLIAFLFMSILVHTIIFLQAYSHYFVIALVFLYIS